MLLKVPGQLSQGVECFSLCRSIGLQFYFYLIFSWINTGVFEEALKSGMQAAEDYRNLWLEYCSYLRRRIDWGSKEEGPLLLELRKTVKSACEHLEQCR